MTIVDMTGLPQPVAAPDQTDDALLTAGEEPVDRLDSDYHELTETLVVTMALGGGCCDIAVSPTTAHVYVADHDSVRVIGTLNHVVASVPVAGHPKALAIDTAGHLVCVTSHDGPVSIINTADNTVKTMPGYSVAAALSPDGAYLYTADNATDPAGHCGWISVIDMESEAVAAVPVDNQVTDLAVTPDGSRLYALTSKRNSYYQYDQGAIAVIDTATRRVIDTIAVGVSPDTLRISPDGTRIYVIHPDTHSISAVDPATRSTKIIVLQDTPLCATVTPDSTHIYLTGLRSLIVVDNTTNTAETIPVGDLPRGVQMSRDGKRAYVANFGSHTVSVLDAITNSVVNTVDVGGNPETLAVSPDGDRLYVGDYWAGRLGVIAIPSVTDHG
ncbi:MAG TPA: YncE family protein [Mycobacterium sp.]|nr:YncE family protein [Mycobacterium sp.]HUH67639.1 YncE family protein [Mycobacterium sp.]